jgi:catechol 2,3-dioxygenase-like lactoylglutathione lyase family enzyme
MPQMQLGAFSCSLAVKDIEASRQFYEKFGLRGHQWETQRRDG